jgi:hypothetical protein
MTIRTSLPRALAAGALAIQMIPVLYAADPIPSLSLEKIGVSSRGGTEPKTFPYWSKAGISPQN